MKGFSILLAALAVLLVSGGCLGQLKPEQMITNRTIADVRFSPDGARLAMTVSEPLKSDGRARHIWVYDVRSHQLRQFTNSTKSEFSPRWSPDGSKLAFLSNREGAAQIFLLPIDGGEAIRLTEGKLEIRSFDWSPDGKQIVILSPEPKTDAEEKKEKDKDDSHVVDKDERQTRVWLFDVASKKARQLTAKPWQISDARWTPDGNSLIVAATDHPESDQEFRRIYSVAAIDGKMKELAAPKGPFGAMQVSPDGKLLAFLGSRVDGPSPHDLHIQSLEGGVSRNLTAKSIDRPIESFVWLNDGTIFANVATGFTSKLYRISPDGKAEETPSFDVNPISFDTRNGQIAFVGVTATDLPELWLSTRAGVAEKVASINESWKNIPLIKPEIIRYKSFDGVEIEGALLKPTSYKPGVKPPMITLIHGGPTGRWASSFDSWGQLLASRGYSVFYPNIRGSVGYGFQFLSSNRADWGGGDFKDVMAGVDYLIAQGIADPEKLGIGGWSYGGYMSAWAITQTNRFKAAVAGAGLSDLASEYGTEAGPSYDEWFYGVPYEKPEGFQKSSPITYIKNAKTPTLILQGEADTTDPMGQSQQLYRGLKRYGVESDFVLYPREPHGFREEKHQLDMLNRIINWYDTHLK